MQVNHGVSKTGKQYKTELNQGQMFLYQTQR